MGSQEENYQKLKWIMADLPLQDQLRIIEKVIWNYKQQLKFRESTQDERDSEEEK